MKSCLINLLRKVSLLKPLFRWYEKYNALVYDIIYRWRYQQVGVIADGLPIPPSEMLVLVAGSANVEHFIESGKLAAQSICSLLSRNNLEIENYQSILDFGCGCGRVMRHWQFLHRTKLYGVDYNPNLIDWCRKNLPFAQFEVNQLFPPLKFSEESFDLIYALSVFTHLPESLQLLWMDELFRILTPGGGLIISTHGASYLYKMTANEREVFQQHQLVVRYEEAAGTNLCTAFHSFEYVKAVLAYKFRLIDFWPRGAEGNPHQDLYLLQKPTNLIRLGVAQAPAP